MKYYNPSQFADVMGYTRQNIFRLCQHGVIKTMRVGRSYLISEKEAIRWFKKKEGGKGHYRLFPRISFKA